MFIKVRYGNDELILLNPQCSVNNLLDSIATRCGMKNSGRTLDLSDETGLVLSLNEHRDQYADLYLKNHSTYILVEKQSKEECLLSCHDPLYEDFSMTKYVALLEDCPTLLPKFKLRVAMESTGHHSHHRVKSPRPGTKTSHSVKSPSRKTKRTKSKATKDLH